MCLYLRNGIIRHCKKIIAIFSVTTLITTALITPSVFATTSTTKASGSSTTTSTTEYNGEETRYNAYLQKIEEEAKKSGITIENYKGNPMY